MLRFLTAGESHGPGLTAILEGLPPGVKVSVDELAAEQARRRWCYGRGGRASIERDEIEITGGVHGGMTTGAPVSVWIPNRDYPNWRGVECPVWTPRPGHADLAGALKYGFTDVRPVIERASARETAARVACGYFAKKLLASGGISVVSWVSGIGDVEASLPLLEERMHDAGLVLALASAALGSPVRCPDPDGSQDMVRAIDAARENGDTLGGVFEAAATGVPPGLGSYVQWDRRLDASISAAVMSINGVKAVEIGEGFALARKSGRQTHDAILPGLRRASNRAGGIEGGVSNGEVIFVRAAHKPLPMLGSPLPSVDLRTGAGCAAHKERSDVCSVGCAAVVAESMLALAIAAAWLERFGHDDVHGRDALHARSLNLRQKS
ncbi:MAG: chorismate synthase [Bacillota bacterium]|nr:chorismate synthase [Bacillota bacterium]